jgi:integrase
MPVRRARAPIFTPLWCLSLSTGARKMEVMGLRWGQVDFGRRAITLHDTKNEEPRALPLTGHALEVLRERTRVRRIDTDRVFPGHDPTQPVDLRTPWETALKRAGIRISAGMTCAIAAALISP